MSAIVLGVPSPPGRPLIELSSNHITESAENSVTDEINITWHVPKDDGGYPITGNFFLFLLSESGSFVAKGCSLHVMS